MTEKRMVFWHVKKLAKEFNMPRTCIGRLLKSLGARQWTSGSSAFTGSIWYWEE